MAEEQDGHPLFGGFGAGSVADSSDEDEVYILVVAHGNQLTAAAHTTERGAMRAALETLTEPVDGEEEHATLEDRYVHLQRVIADDGGAVEIISSRIHEG